MEHRFALVSSVRWLVPAAIALGLLGAAAGPTARARVTFGVGSGTLALLGAIGRWRRPTLIIDEQGYRVTERGRERLSVAFAEVVRARAVPAERALYLDCGDPARNLLVPPRHGFGFRFARQAELYLLLARQLGDKLVVVAELVEP